MLVVSSAFFWTLQSPRVHPFAYADNWSYLTASQRDNIQAFHKIQHLVEALRMQIDFAKSWAWGATADARQDWKDFLHHDFPQRNQVPILNSTKDLGCMTHYSLSVSLKPRLIVQSNAANAFDGFRQISPRRLVLSKQPFGHMLSSELRPKL